MTLPSCKNENWWKRGKCEDCCENRLSLRHENVSRQFMCGQKNDYTNSNNKFEHERSVCKSDPQKSMSEHTSVFNWNTNTSAQTHSVPSRSHPVIIFSLLKTQKFAQSNPFSVIWRYTQANTWVTLSHSRGTWWRSWLGHCATSRKVAGSIPDGVIGISRWPNLSGRTLALGLTQPLTEMSTMNISWGVKVAGA